ncbi:hypothetical protein [Streptomyces sp. NPDC093225]|uniref:hypothetical protein n=1 Tax=Streptomyces sp. NPDC093225 TaxID=3366034 RepID=UPI0038141918
MVQEWDWTTVEFGDAHAGTAGVLLADGTEPDPVYVDAGSGPEGYPTTHWTAYDGQHGSPRARALRAACACGWRGAAEYPLDRRALGDGPPEEHRVDLSGPLADWNAHLSVVRETVVPLPEPLAGLLLDLSDELGDVVADAPLAALRAVGILRRIIAEAADEAAEAVHDSGASTESVAAALGTTPSEAFGLLLRYDTF